MKARRSIAVLAVAAAVAMLAPLAASASDDIRDVGSYRVGARFNVRPHIGHQDYNGKRHVISGTIGLTNTANRAREVRCSIVITFKDIDGTARVKRTDQVHVRVGPHTTRHPDYRVQLRDTIHRYQNTPVNQQGHCHRLS